MLRNLAMTAISIFHLEPSATSIALILSLTEKTIHSSILESLDIQECEQTWIFAWHMTQDPLSAERCSVRHDYCIGIHEMCYRLDSYGRGRSTMSNCICLKSPCSREEKAADSP